MRSLLALAAVVGCYHDKPVQRPVPANKVTAPQETTADDVLAFLPADSEIVIGVEMATLRQSALYRTFEPQLANMFGDALPKAKACGFDLATLAGATLAGKGFGRDGMEGVLVLRGLDGRRVLECMAKPGALRSDRKVTRNGAVLELAMDDDGTSVLGLANPSTLVAVFGKDANRTTFERTLASGAPLRTSPTFLGLFERREPNASVWGMVNGNSNIMAEVRQAGANPKVLDGTVIVTDVVSVVGRMTFATDAEATQLVNLISPSMAPGRAMLQRLDVRADGPVLRVDAQATEAQLRSLAGLFGGFFP